MINSGIGIMCWIVLSILGLVETAFQQVQTAPDLKRFGVALAYSFLL